jgi:hypothetical protein
MMKNGNIAIAIIGVAAVLAGAIACKNPIKEKVEEINASEAPAIGLMANSVKLSEGETYTIGATALDTTKTATFTIKNSGQSGLKARVKVTGDFDVASQPSSTISPGKESTFVIGFTPTSPEGVKSGTVTVSSNDPENGNYSFKVVGVGSTIMLPKTGQTTSYAAGDDGALQVGVAWPGTRFFLQEADTYIDTLTGLMWLADPDPYGAVPWATALSDGDSASNDGYPNWRIPNRTELMSLIDYSQASPKSALQSLGFNKNFHTVQNEYWTSSSNSSPTNIKWFVNFAYGTVSNDLDSGTYHCWLVRTTTSGRAIDLPRTGSTVSANALEDGASPSGSAWPSPRFVSRGDGTISDLLTGLRWQSAPSTTKYSWANALAIAASSTLGGSSAWRLPNVNELNSIVNIGAADPAVWLNTQGFSNVQSGVYWTSTAYAPTFNSRWAIDLSAGYLNGANKDTTNYIVLVRSE